MLKSIESRTQHAEETLYDWACDLLPTSTAKTRCAAQGFEIDFRQAENGHIIEAYDTVAGELVELEI